MYLTSVSIWATSSIIVLSALSAYTVEIGASPTIKANNNANILFCLYMFPTYYVLTINIISCLSI